MSEASELDFDLDPLILNQAQSLDDFEAAPMPWDEHSANDDTGETELFADGDEDIAAEMVVDGIEIATQFFGHERYEMEESRRAVLVGAYGRLMKKYEGKAPSWLGQYKEEIIVVIVTAFVMIGTFSSVKKLKQEDYQKALEARQKEEQSRGEKSERKA